jgi:hypothetical protein
MRFFLIWSLAGMSFLTAQNKTYFQQDVKYTIQVSLDDVNHELKGKETLEYKNNSNTNLDFIWFHLWPNGYKDNHTALGKQLLENGSTEFYFAKPEERGFIDGLEFREGENVLKTETHPEWIDVIKVFLSKPLAPGQSTVLTTPFRVKIPKGGFSRLGHAEQQYQITQWYPKPAVFDKNGWHPMPYLDQGEFYSEFGSFDVSITLPANYVLGATGDLVDGEKEKEFIQKKIRETRERDWSDLENNKKGFPPSSTELKTLRFYQENVHDFAWFCDKRYNVLNGEVELPHSKRKVETYVLFTDEEASLWKNSIPYLNDAIYFYSKWNGDYPYNHATAVDGALGAGGGMEYPNITIIGKTGSAMSLETVIMHEIGHNWFYGILGSNERKHPWMDEGLNSFNENRYVETKYPNAGLLGGQSAGSIERMFHLDKFNHKSTYYLAYILNARKKRDQPIEFPSAEYTRFNYGGIVYSKTALVFDYLMAYLGEETMDKAMQTYFEEWKFKHPQPEDLREVIERVSGKNLSWFFTDVINTTLLLDFKIKGISKEGNKVTVTLKNTGEIFAPACVAGIKDGKIHVIKWTEPFSPHTTTQVVLEGDFDKIQIDPLFDIPEINRNNNIMRTWGLFRKVEPLKLHFPAGLDHPDATQLFWVPAFGYNPYNGFFAGAAFYSNLAPEKPFDFVAVPMYGFGDKSICGVAETNINIHTRSFLRTIRFTTSGKRFAYNDFPFEEPLRYNRLQNQLYLEFKKGNERSKYTHFVQARNIFMQMDNFRRKTGFTPDLYEYVSDTLMFNEFSMDWILPAPSIAGKPGPG